MHSGLGLEVRHYVGLTRDVLLRFLFEKLISGVPGGLRFDELLERQVTVNADTYVIVIGASRILKLTVCLKMVDVGPEGGRAFAVELGSLGVCGWSTHLNT